NNTCAAAGCGVWSLTNNKYNLCEVHCCYDCDKIRIYKSNYCLDHNCKFPDCIEKKTDIKYTDYCYKHFHDEKRKLQLQFPNKCDDFFYKKCDQDKIENGYFCEKHTCKLCHWRILDNKLFCGLHVCSEDKCSAKPEIQAYCLEHSKKHICNENKCVKYIFHHNKCTNHACRFLDCDGLRDTESSTRCKNCREIDRRK